MIHSYIFDPQEVQTSGYVNEINNYKSDEQDGGKFNHKRNNDIQVHKNELQNTDVQPPVNRHKLNNTKDVVWNHKSTVLHGEGHGNCVEKPTFSINGIHSYSGGNLNPNPSTSQSNDAYISSDQLSNSSATKPTQPKECDDDNFPEDHPRLPSETIESLQYKESLSARQHKASAESVLCEFQGSGTYLIASGDSQTASQAGTQREVGSEHLPNHHTHTHQSKHRDLLLCKSRSCDSDTDDVPPPRSKAEVAQEVKYACQEELNGEIEEDADIAEALAALEAATAGEDSEEEEEED